MSLLRATNRPSVNIGLVIANFAIIAAAMIQGHPSQVDPRQRFLWCLLVAVLIEIVLIIDLIQCIRSCPDNDDGCVTDCISNYAKWALFFTLVFIYVCFYHIPG